jgi:hypothetical protein
MRFAHDIDLVEYRRFLNHLAAGPAPEPHS